jgi:hypothetical protein
MTEIFQALRLLSICMTRAKLSPMMQASFTRGLYIVEYKLLVLLDQTDPRDDDIILSRSSHIYGSLRLAAYLYLYVMLRELPPTAEINYTLARRLQAVLKANKADLLVVWKDDLHLLLWITTMGSCVTLGSPEGPYFLDLLKRVRCALGLETLEMYRDSLKKVLYLDTHCWEKGTLAFWSENPVDSQYFRVTNKSSLQRQKNHFSNIDLLLPKIS